MESNSLKYAKGLGKFPKGSYNVGWNIGNEEVSLPTAVVHFDKVKHNVNWMKAFMQAYGLELCPHVKTTMCPKLIELQLTAGAWGVTTANAHQTSIVHAMGLTKRIIMANQLVGKRNMEIISELLAADPQLEFMPIVDSARNVQMLHEFFQARNQKLDVLIEIGIPLKGRTGVRNYAEFENVLEAIKKTEGWIRPRGIEFYEGLIQDVDGVRELCQRAITAAKGLLASVGEGEKEIIISGAGSAKFDIVAEELSAAKSSLEAAGWKTPLIILRPGCYITHDIGLCREAEKRFQQTNAVAKSLGTLQPALQIVAYVQSIPEPNLAILGMGKRDVAIDCDMPIPASMLRPGPNASWSSCPNDWTVTNVMDQHLFMKTPSSFKELLVGDMIAFNISHPCNNFSAWKQVLVVDESYTVSDIFLTYF